MQASGRLVLIAVAAGALCAGLPRSSTGAAVEESYGGRSLLVFAASRLPPPGSRALVVVLHGGLGSAQGIESGRSESPLSLDAVAEKYGFVVAYLNGTPVTRRLSPERLGWNAGGGCCGLSAENGIDDVAYIQGAVRHVADERGIDGKRIYGIGHSNGAMMTQRLFCETALYAAAVAISGPLNLAVDKCPAARGRRILAIHGADDQNVPIAGGRGSKGISTSVYNSEARSREVFIGSGASYELQVVGGADHALVHLESAIEALEGRSIAEKAAGFFGLTAGR